MRHGFDEFKAAIDAAHEALGHDPAVRKALHVEAKAHLRRATQSRRGGGFSYPEWIEATPSDFEDAAHSLTKSLTIGRGKPSMVADFLGAQLAIFAAPFSGDERGPSHAHLVGGGYHLQVAFTMVPSAGRGDWSIALTDVGEELSREHRTARMRSVVARTNAKSQAGADRALQDLLTRHFQVKFAGPETVG